MEIRDYLNHRLIFAGSLVDAVVAGIDLSCARFDDLNLEGVNLSRVKLCRASFRHTFLKNANLQGSNLQNACLFGAFLRGADLSGANLTGATLGCDLRDANLTQTIMPDGRTYEEWLEEPQRLIVKLADHYKETWR